MLLEVRDGMRSSRGKSANFVIISVRKSSTFKGMSRCEMMRNPSKKQRQFSYNLCLPFPFLK